MTKSISSCTILYQLLTLYFPSCRKTTEVTGNMDTALWLVAITFLTVGYGDVSPKTTCGKAVCLFTGVMVILLHVERIAEVQQKRRSYLLSSVLVPNQTTTKTKRSIAVFLFRCVLLPSYSPTRWFHLFVLFHCSGFCCESYCSVSALLFDSFCFSSTGATFSYFLFLPYFAKVHFSPPGFALYLGSNWEIHRKSLFALLNILMVLTGHRCNRRATAEVRDLGGTKPWSEQNVCMEYDVSAEWRCFAERCGQRLHFSLSLFFFFWGGENKCNETCQLEYI